MVDKIVEKVELDDGTVVVRVTTMQPFVDEHKEEDIDARIASLEVQLVEAHEWKDKITEVAPEEV